MSTIEGQNDGKLARAKFIRLVAGAGAVATITYLAEDMHLRENIFGVRPEPENLIPDYISNTPLLVKKGVKIRTSPFLPKQGKFWPRDNVVPWEAIGSIQGKNIREKSGFIISDAPIVYGDRVTTEDPNIADNRWIKFAISQFGSQILESCYVSFAEQKKLLTTLSEKIRFRVPHKNKDQSFSDVNGRQFGFRLHGDVYVPEFIETAARDIMPQIWSKKMAEKFGEYYTYPVLPREKGERLVESIVVSGPRDKGVLRNETFASVLSFPAESYLNGENVKVLGTIPIGTKVKNVIVNSEHAIFAVNGQSGFSLNERNEDRVNSEDYKRYGALPLSQIAF